MNTLDCINNSQCGREPRMRDCACAARVREAAAFLDAVAARFLDTRPRGWDEIERAAADCRAMAKKLRGEK
jgi:hypothetical protein